MQEFLNFFLNWGDGGIFFLGIMILILPFVLIWQLLRRFRKKSEITPIKMIPRHRCPFYGFGQGFPASFMDTKGNQCALITGSFSPCPMKMNGDTPDWNACTFFNTEENSEVISEIEKGGQIFPKEFDPPNQRTWGGISFSRWKEYVMGDSVSRP